jgi:uracil-DNA glycosylase family 4
VTKLEKLQTRVIRCRKCPRLVAYLKEVSKQKPKRFRDWDYWAKPLPSFGDPNARVLIVGLAPAANGGTRTGRMFTGDRSGEWLFGALYQFGFANQSTSSRRDDDFSLSDCYITATIRCAPPGNKPLPEETENCRPYFLEELDLLKNLKIIVPLGQIAFIQTLRSLRLKGFKIPPCLWSRRVYDVSTKIRPNSRRRTATLVVTTIKLAEYPDRQTDKTDVSSNI